MILDAGWCFPTKIFNILNIFNLDCLFLLLYRRAQYKRKDLKLCVGIRACLCVFVHFIQLVVVCDRGGDPGEIGGGGGSGQDTPEIRTQLFLGVRGPPWRGQEGSALEAGVVFTGARLASYVPIMICNSVCQRDSLKRFVVVKNRPLLVRLPWPSTEVTLTLSRSLPFANTVCIYANTQTLVTSGALAIDIMLNVREVLR